MPGLWRLWACPPRRFCTPGGLPSVGGSVRPCAAFWRRVVRDSTPAPGGSVGRFRAFPAVLFPGLWIACPCAPLLAALWPVSGLACTPVPLPGCVALWRLWAGVYGTACTRGRLCPPVRRCPGAVALALCPSFRRGLWRDREKPGQAVQAPPGRKRTAAGIAPGAALWFHLFIFSNSDRIANGIIKSTKRTNIFDFHPLKQR